MAAGTADFSEQLHTPLLLLVKGIRLTFDKTIVGSVRSDHGTLECGDGFRGILHSHRLVGAERLTKQGS
jgi:hypothetical protein